MSVPKGQFLRESWLTWLILGLSLVFLVWDLDRATSPGGSPWYWLPVGWFAVLVASGIRLLRRQARWVAGRAAREAHYREIRENFLVSMYRSGVPDEIAAKIDMLIEAEKYPEAARLILRHMPHLDGGTNPK